MKFLIITPRLPYPIDKGDKLRAFYQIKYLSQNHEIFLYSLNEHGTDSDCHEELKKYCKKVKVKNLSRKEIFINLLRGILKKIPFQTAYYYSNNTKNDIENFIDEVKPDLIYCQLIRAAEFLKETANIPKVIDFIDVISKGLERRIQQSNFLWKIILKEELRRVIRYEEEVFNSFDKTLIITEEDKNFLLFEGKENVIIVPNGVDMEFFHPIPFPKKYHLFFSGNLNYPPNINASQFIAEKILPHLKEKLPDVKILIGGASPNPSVVSLQSENIIVKGWVEDIRDYYKESSIFLAPMQMGTGLQNKLLQAMAMKIPCIVSELTAKGLSNGEKDFVLVANTPNEYTELALKLIHDESFANELAVKGYNFVKDRYDWNAIIANLEKILLDVINKYKV